MEKETNDSPVYYKILITNEGLKVVCLQWFDEFDYPKNKWFGERQFNTEEEAQEVVDAMQGNHYAIGKWL